MLPNEPKCLQERQNPLPLPAPVPPLPSSPRPSTVEPSKNPVAWLIVAGLAIAVLGWFATGWIKEQQRKDRLRRFAEIERLVEQGRARRPVDLFDDSIFRPPGTPEEVYVLPYVRDDGGYVQGHFRTEADDTTRNNWTTRPNVNPYTGERGYRRP